MILKYTAGQSDDGRKVYSIMRRSLHISQTLTRRLKKGDGIRVGGKPVFTNYILKPGESLEIDISAAEPPCGILPESGPLCLLYEDAGLIAVNKPAGLITHPSRARYTGTLANFVAGYLVKSRGSGCCHAVNRLDRDTSGIVLFAKNSHIKALASAALSSPDAVKEYTALVLGEMDPPSGTMKAPIKRLRERNLRRIVSPDGQPAVTHYETLAIYKVEGFVVSCIRLFLETGRTHQIRVHSLSAGHPILGDGMYNTKQSQKAADMLCIESQALHAQSLSFTKPLSNKRLSLTAKAPEVFERINKYELL